MRCPKMDELPVINEWQNQILCPNCKFYYNGTCKNPERKKETDPCPFEKMDNIEVKDEK